VRLIRVSTFLILFALACVSVGYGQGVGSSGDIKGTVTDQNGAVVANATVTLTDADKGTKRTVGTDKDGQYRLTSIQPGTYIISVEGPGFQPAKKALLVHVGETVVADVRLGVTAVSADVNVTGESAVIETEKGGQAESITQKFIQQLPIDRRDYLTFSLLLPGVSDSRNVVDNQDFRVKQTPQSGLSFYGSNGRGNGITVDGGEANDDAGGVRLTLSQDAVQEFQVNRSNYTAELGYASGASINIISKTGTNLIHGSAFGYFRNQRLDARNPFSFNQALAPGQVFNPAQPDHVATPVKNLLTRGQFGGTFSFPIKKDKTFFFVAYEGLRRNAENSVPLLTTTSIFRPTGGQQTILNGLAAQGATPVPCLTGQPALPSNICAGILQNILTVNPAASPLSSFAVNIFEQNGGLFPFTSKSDLFSARLDHQFNEKNQAYLRFSFGRDRERDPNVQALNGESRGNLYQSVDNTAQAGWYHQFSATTQNELRLQWNLSKTDVVPNDPQGVGLDIAGFGSFGRDIFLPSFSTMHREDFADNLTTIVGNHTLKMGFDVLLRGNNTESHTFFAGRFSFGELPGGILSPCLQVPAACGINVAPSTIDSLQAFTLGLPQFYQQGFGDPVVSSTNPYYGLYVEDAYHIKSNLTLNLGLRYEYDRRRKPLHSDGNNFAPRFSFAYEPFKDHKTAIRGGFGIFYAPVNYQIDYVVQALGVVNGVRQIAQVFVPLTGAPGNPALTSAAIFQTLFAQGKVQCQFASFNQDACITPADLTQFGINITHTGAIPPLSVIFGGASDFQNPYSEQADISIEREIAPGLAISGSYIYSHTMRIARARDINLLPAPFTPSGPAGIPIQNWGASACTANPFACFVNPLLLQNNLYESTANAVYNAGIIEVTKRFSRHFSLLANYTYSKAIDDTTDYNSDYEAANQLNLPAERALSAFDQRHKFVFAGVFESPWTGGSNATTTEKIFSGFTFSPIFRASSARPFNLLAGTDINGDHHPTTDRPAGAGRNTGIGPNYWTFDARLARQFSINEKVKLDATIEAFDLFNRTNFLSINNTVGNIAPPFNLSGTTAASPSQPLGFTSALPGREFQLGLRISF